MIPTVLITATTNLTPDILRLYHMEVKQSHPSGSGVRAHPAESRAYPTPHSLHLTGSQHAVEA